MNYEIKKWNKKFIGEGVKYDEWDGGYLWGYYKKESHQIIAQSEASKQTKTSKSNHL